MADSELPANVRALIEAADKAPVSADRTAIRTKVLATIGDAGAGGAGGSSAAKLVMGAAVAVVVVGGAYFALHTRRTVIAVSPSVSASASDRPATPTPTPKTTITILEPAPAMSAPASVAAPRSPNIARPAPAKTDPRPSTDAVEHRADEAAWLAKATYALRSGDPERTLSLVESYTHLFAHGALAEERDALEIEALLALGRRDAAHAAAQRFAQRYPQSVHASLVTRALQPGSSP